MSNGCAKELLTVKLVDEYSVADIICRGCAKIVAQVFVRNASIVDSIKVQSMFSILKKTKSPPKVAVLGLDGVPSD